MSSKLVIPVALGFSLVTVTALVVYYVFKKDDEDGEKTVKSARVNVIEVNIPKSIVPALIGRSGSNIKDIEKKSGAMIHFKKFSDKEYDVCIIRGRRHATQLAETLVHEFLQQQPVIQEENMTVPGWACGRIIGAGGETINDISHRSGARVKIDSSGTRDSSTRGVCIRGTAEQIQQAKKLIESCVAQEKCRREIEQSKRSPRHAPATPSQARDAVSDDTDGSSASIEVYVSAVSSPSRFWVQLVGPQVAQLDELVANMTEYYGRAENRENHKLKQVSVGQVVAAVFRHDGRWYRARVHDIRPNEFDATQQVADVFYVDYGDSEYVATHELCELRANLLKLRFQAMECFLAGVKPIGTQEDTEAVTAGGARYQRWHPQAVERFEELAQVARWKPLVSRTMTYRRAAGDGDWEKEVPGIALYDVTHEGELDIGATLIEEGWAAHAELSPRPSPPRAPPFGDLTHSSILGMAGGGGEGTRASSVPKDHRDEQGEQDHRFPTSSDKENDKMTSSKSHASGLEKSDRPNPSSVSNFDLAYPAGGATSPRVNGSNDFIAAEKTGSAETLTPRTYSEELKANMNRIDSHHNLEDLTRSQSELHTLHK